MEMAIEKMEAQLHNWGSRIDQLSAKTLTPGARTSFDTLVYIDELKALHAIARSKLDEVKASSSTENILLETEAMSAWNDLRAAVNDMSRRR